MYLLHYTNRLYCLVKIVVVRTILISLLRNSVCLEFVTAGTFNAGVGFIRSGNAESGYRHSDTLCFESYP